MNLYKEPDIAKKITGLVKKTRSLQNDWRTEAKEDFNFPAGHQWDGICADPALSARSPKLAERDSQQKHRNAREGGARRHGCRAEPCLHHCAEYQAAAGRWAAETGARLPRKPAGY